ncbi:MAG: hypothetical protein HY597_01755 [Candidatus Omnitrophica bacterium]|nr:hypothetical protein [Candidatus Omnitrophota bacterium]
MIARARRCWWIVGVLGGAVCGPLGSGCASSAPSQTLQWEAMHSTNPAVHHRLAAAYRSAAKKLRKRAARYRALAEEMATAYEWKGQTAEERAAMIVHYKDLAKNFEDSAQQNDALADEHEEHAGALENFKAMIE